MKAMMVRFFVLAIGFLIVVAISGCGIDPCDDPALDPDCYYARHDPSFATAQARVLSNEIQNSKITPQSTLVVLPTEKYQVLSTDTIQCTIVLDGDGVGSAAQRANNGVFPPTLFASTDMQVFIKHGSEKTIMTLTEAIRVSPVIYPGDTICISINPSLFDK